MLRHSVAVPDVTENNGYARDLPDADFVHKTPYCKQLIFPSVSFLLESEIFVNHPQTNQNSDALGPSRTSIKNFYLLLTQMTQS